VLFKGKRETLAIDGGANREVRVVYDQRSAHFNDEDFTVSQTQR